MKSFICFVVLATACHLAAAQAVDVDAAHSSITVKVEKSGLFSAFAHNHTIHAPIASGHLDTEKHTATLTFNAKDMKVIDEGVKDSERADIEQTMKSDKVLDVDHYPEISFTSTRVTSTGTDHWLVNGMLTLHGETHGVTLKVEKVDGKYTGSVAIKQKDYGIIPVSVAGGTIKVRDEVSIEFAIVTK